MRKFLSWSCWKSPTQRRQKRKAPAFPDRRGQLFGRDPDIKFLADRARQRGLTALVARPLMGKTWTLTEVGRRLAEGGEFLIGYHEATGAERSHLLYAISDLYTRWLADSGLWAQARSQWERHKGMIVPKVGQAVGRLFEKLNKLGEWVPEGIAELVRDTFDGLAAVQKDLLTGGVQLAPLDYEQARDLARLAARLSGKRVIIILDAWEKSSSVRLEHQTLEAYLNHLDDWPGGHLFLGIRHPELDLDGSEDEAFKRAKDLAQRTAAAQIHKLPPMHLAATERQHMIDYVRELVPAARQLTDQDLLGMIDGFPGVLSFWLDEVNRKAMRVRDDLHQQATDAQQYRYREFDQLLPRLAESHRTLAARLAFFPGLSNHSWQPFRGVLLGAITDSIFDDLIGSHVLENEDYPTYGHDKRHAAAARWFIQHHRPLFRRVGMRIIWNLARLVSGANAQTLPFAAVLAGCDKQADALGMDGSTLCLIDAVLSLFGNDNRVLGPEFEVAWREAISKDCLVTPLIAMGLQNRGFAKRKRGDFGGAVSDYTAVIELRDAPPEEVAKALVNRAFVKGEFKQDWHGEIEDCSRVIEMSGATIEQCAYAFINRAFAKENLRDSDGAIKDHTAVIDMSDAPAALRAQAFYGRGVVKGQLCGDSKGVIADYTNAIELPGASTEYVAKALFNRGVRKGRLGDIDGEIADYTTITKLSGAPVDQIAKACLNRGRRLCQRGDTAGGIADYRAVIELPGAPAELVSLALEQLSKIS